MLLVRGGGNDILYRGKALFVFELLYDYPDYGGDHAVLDRNMFIAVMVIREFKGNHIKYKEHMSNFVLFQLDMGDW